MMHVRPTVTLDSRTIGITMLKSNPLVSVGLQPPEVVETALTLKNLSRPSLKNEDEQSDGYY